jgi:hypothetical protein
MGSEIGLSHQRVGARELTLTVGPSSVDQLALDSRRATDIAGADGQD